MSDSKPPRGDTPTSPSRLADTFQDPEQWLDTLLAQAHQQRHRVPISLSGSAAWRQQWRDALQARVTLERTLILPVGAISTAEGRRLLGREFQLVVVQGEAPPPPDLLAIVSGTLAGGGVLLFDLEDPTRWSGVFNGWLRAAICDDPRVLQLTEGHSLPTLPSMPMAPPLQADHWGCLGLEQRQAVKGVLQVVHGHRRRPLVLTAERGRGKSAALGIAAALLLAEGRQRVLVTAPKRAALDSLFQHALQQLPDATSTRDSLLWQQGEIRYLPPDQLLHQTLEADLLLVDEAAALPAPLLHRLLDRYARIAFATTTQGYEGTGRGFEIRFRQRLNQRTPGWKALTLSQPIRWAEGDPLERWLYDTLLLDAEPAPAAAIAELTSDLKAQRWSGAQLLADPAVLRQLFGLLVLAHYQTTPNDLRDLLQGEGMSVWLIRQQKLVVAAMLTVEEGTLPDNLAMDIWLGQRRPQGHLLPQALIAHNGWLAAAGLRYQRVIRIAVHPACQRQGLGHRLLRALEEAPVDLLGSSFAASEQLPAFWRQAGYRPLRLGLQRDAASGCHSLLVVKPLTEAGRQLVSAAEPRFWQHWSTQLSSVFHELEPALLWELLSDRPTDSFNLIPEDACDLVAYVLGGRGFEQVEPVLARWLLEQPECWQALPAADRELLIRRVLQRQSVASCCESAGLQGRRQLETRLRQLLLPVVKQQVAGLLPPSLLQRVLPLLDD